ncbi:MAG: translation elongation factor Ts [Candidatus Levybacteria bacterium]|nr:translation elongation factor Ts [Candidatus Levybacteria bacterium]
MIVNINDIKRLRNETGVSVADCRRALEETSNDLAKAREWLKKHGLEKAGKKADRVTMQGLVEAYVHQNGRIGAMVEVLCETDFVAKTDEFKHLAHEIAMQVAAMNPSDVASLFKQEYIRDASKTVEQLVKETISKLGENIVVRRIVRMDTNG